MTEIARRQRMNTVDEMYAAIGYGGLQLSRLMMRIKEEYNRMMKEKDPKVAFQIPVKKQKNTDGVIVEGLDNCLVKFAKCCNPLPGDRIIGFITRGYGVSIHKRDCVNVRADGSDPRWVQARWDDGVKESFKSTLEISAMDRNGLFTDVSALLGDMRIPIYAINARQTTDGRATMTVTIGITIIEHLNSAIQRLRKVKDVIGVNRI